MGQSRPVQLRKLESFEELNEAVRGAQREVIQLGRGRVRGYMAHLSVGGLPIDIGQFSLGVRSTGILSPDRTAIGMLTGRNGRVTQWSRDANPGDVFVTPPRAESERTYHGGASYAVITLSADDIGSFFRSEPRLRDIDNWRRGHFRAAFHGGERLLPRLRQILSRLQQPDTALTTAAAEFWKRSIIEAMTSAIVLDTRFVSDDRSSTVKVLRKIDEYLEQAKLTPPHISEICGALNFSRRTLHRAFHDALGMGPVTFLQRRRLCSVHSALRDGDPATTTIADIALQHGFLNLGRFSGYYRALFDEYPSETFGKACPGRNRTKSSVSDSGRA